MQDSSYEKKKSQIDNKLERQRRQKTAPLEIQKGDYYMNDEGLMVFTAQYHLRRGYCCGSGCKHCPYDN